MATNRIQPDPDVADGDPTTERAPTGTCCTARPADATPCCADSPQDA